MVPRRVGTCLYEGFHRSEVAWWVEAESKRPGAKQGRLVGRRDGNRSVPLGRRAVTKSRQGRTAPLSQVRGRRPASPSRACWRRSSDWGWRVAGKQHSSSSQTQGRSPTCPPLGRRRRRLARQSMRCRLLLGHGCPASSSIGGGGDGTNPDVVLPPCGEEVIDSAAGGQADGCHCRCRAVEEGVSCRNCRRGT
jgi:hypothetical protein